MCRDLQVVNSTHFECTMFGTIGTCKIATIFDGKSVSTTMLKSEGIYKFFLL